MHQLNSSCTFFISCVDLYPGVSQGPLPCDRGRHLLKGTACISVTEPPPTPLPTYPLLLSISGACSAGSGVETVVERLFLLSCVCSDICRGSCVIDVCFGVCLICKWLLRSSLSHWCFNCVVFWVSSFIFYIEILALINRKKKYQSASSWYFYMFTFLLLVGVHMDIFFLYTFPTSSVSTSTQLFFSLSSSLP